MTKALLLGAYGQTNLGDDLLMLNYLRHLKTLGITDVHANASDITAVPKIICNEFPGLKLFATYDTSPRDLLKLARSADYIFYGGGTVYKELYSSTGRSRYSVIGRIMVFNMVARLLGKKIINLHIGIGSIKTPLGRWITRTALAACTHTTFRDKESYQFARDKLALPAKSIEASTDGLFLNDRWRKPWHRAGLQPRAKKTVGINMLSDIPDWIDRQTYLQTMTDFTQHLMDKGYFVIFLPFQTGFNTHNDLLFMQTEVIPFLKSKNFAVAEDTDITTITSYLQRIDVLVGMRFHSLLLAASAGTPFLAVAYDTKCLRFVREADYPYALSIEKMNVETLGRAFDNVVKHSAVARSQLARVANQNFKDAVTWTQNHPL